MDAELEYNSTENRFITLVRWLGLNDPQRKQKAADFLCCAGTPASRLLIEEAIKPGKESHHRIAILDVVQRIGGPLGPDELFGLQSLLQDRNPDVGRKAEVVIMSLSPSGLPDSPEAAARMRLLNPFLTPIPRGRKSSSKSFKSKCRQRSRARCRKQY